MEFLKLLQGIRFPVLNWIMQAITYCGEETVFMVVAIILFWCVDKWKGYYILSVGFLGTLLNQFLKLVFRVPRPWTVDESIIVPSAKEGASGFTFPSGHTQGAVGTFGGIARFSKDRRIHIAAIVLIVLVAFSRMYLGAHYPSDVAVSLVTGVILVFALYPVLQKGKQSPRFMYGFLAVMILLAAAYVLYANLARFPAEVEGMKADEVQECYRSGAKNGYTLLGSLLGMVIAYTVDLKKLHFEEKAPLLGQILKVVLGLACVMAIRIGLSKFFALISDALYWNAVRYFCMVVFTGAVWPLTFPLWQKVGAKEKTDR